jgi:hypothetical protein
LSFYAVTSVTEKSPSSFQTCNYKGAKGNNNNNNKNNKQRWWFLLNTLTENDKICKFKVYDCEKYLLTPELFNLLWQRATVTIVSWLEYRTRKNYSELRT